MNEYIIQLEIPCSFALIYINTCIPSNIVFTYMYINEHAFNIICIRTSKDVSIIDIDIQKKIEYVYQIVSVTYICHPIGQLILLDMLYNITLDCIQMLHVSMLYNCPFHLFRNRTVFQYEPIECNIMYMFNLCLNHVYNYGRNTNFISAVTGISLL